MAMSYRSAAFVLIAFGALALLSCVCIVVATIAVSKRRDTGEADKQPLIAAGPAGNFPDEKIDVAGKTRQFRLIVPKSVDRARPAPLVIAFHGMLIDSKDFMPVYTKLDVLADDKKFILAFPEAIGKSWGLAPDKVKADLEFFDALVADVGKRYNVDLDRIYVTGMSNGGYFAHLVGKERSQKVAAVCSHSGPLGLQTLLGIGAERKFPVMIVCGDKDQIFPVAFFRDNRDRYTREKHTVKYVEVPELGHVWATDQNDAIWEFFAANPLK